MRLATILDDGDLRLAVVRGEAVLALDAPGAGLDSLRSIAAGGPPALARIQDWVARQPESVFRPLEGVTLGPAVPDPGAIYAIGLNYAEATAVAPATPTAVAPATASEVRPDRPFVFGKAPTSVVGHGGHVAWDRALTSNVDAECELGVVVGDRGAVFGYTIVNNISSRDPWLDGDQWLLGKSMPGFCPVGPWVVTADELDPADLRLGCAIDGAPIQDCRTSRMRFSIAEILAFLGRHLVLRPGDLVATGTPPRLAAAPGLERHLETGDMVTCWIEGIGELTTRIG